MSEFSTAPSINEVLEQSKIAAAKAEAEVQKSKATEEQEFLPEITVSEEDLMLYWNLMLKKKPYTKDYSVKGLEFTLSTISVKQRNEVSQLIDKKSFALREFKDSIATDYALAAALSSYSGEDLRNFSIENRHKFIEELPVPVVKLLLKRLAEFEAWTYKANWVLEKGNF